MRLQVLWVLAVSVYPPPEPLPPPDPTPLTDGGGAVELALAWLASKFHFLAADIAGIWMIGDALAAPFSFFGDLFDDAAAGWWQLFIWLTDVQNFLWTRLDWPGWVNSFRELMPELFFIETLPWTWIITKLNALVEDFWLLEVDSARWVASRLGSTWEFVVDLEAAPAQWVFDRISDLWPDYDYFLTDTRSWINGWIITLWPEWETFRQDPLQALISWVWQINHELARLFIENPLRVVWYWCEEYFDHNFEEVAGWLQQAATQLILHLW